MSQLNGWQRIGIVLSVLWFVGVIAKTAYESYEAASFNAYILECCKEERAKSPQTEKSSGRLITHCEAADVCAQGIKRSTTPQSLPLLALLFLPVAAGWAAAYISRWTTKWIRDGFKT